nr:EOG090X03EV [Lepidurus arcticus]
MTRWNKECHASALTESAEALLAIKNGGLSLKGEEEIKVEDSTCPSDDPEDEPMILGPEMLGLKRVGDDRPAKVKPGSNSVVLNRRGTPARVRKKNRLFYDENVVMGPTTRSPRKSKAVSAPSSPVKRPMPNTRANKAKTPPPAPKRTLKLRAAAASATPRASSSTPASPAAGSGPSTSPQPSIISTRGARKSNVPNLERNLTKVLGTRLRNLLKLPKAHKWVCYEWFYSNIDKVLFEGDNDFMVCLKESFPQLKTRSLTRVEWCAIRKLMGRPRRCSQAFFTEEREELARKRKNIRLLQQRKVTDLSAVTRDLPDEIPLPLSIGTKVTARLRQPQDGLFMGQVDAVDTSNNTYRISFDRQGIGTHSVHDYEVLSNETPDMISLTSLTQRFRPRPPAYLNSSTSTLPFPSSPSNANTLSSSSIPFLSPIPPGQSHGLASPMAKSIPGSPRPNLISGDPLFGGSSPLKPRPPRLDSTLGEYPVAFLMRIVQLTKVLESKKKKISMLREMNAEAEKRESFNEEIRGDFQRMYARVVLDLEGLNRQLNSLLLQVREHCQELALLAKKLRAKIVVTSLRRIVRPIAFILVMKMQIAAPATPPETASSISALITGLTSLMLQIKCLAETDRQAYELQALQETLGDLRTKLEPSNLTSFRNHVEVHIQHIQSGFNHWSNLTAFMRGDHTNSGATTGTREANNTGHYHRS